MSAWLQGALHDYALDLLSEPSIAGLGFLHPQKTHALAAEKFTYFPAHPEDLYPLFQVWKPAGTVDMGAGVSHCRLKDKPFSC